MEFKIIHGKFDLSDAIDLIDKLIKVKISFHEDKINSSMTEEEIKMRENRIKELQQYLHQIRTEFLDEPLTQLEILCNLNIQTK